MYNNRFSDTNPGLVIIMIDQSSYMNTYWADEITKAQFAASLVNKIINEILYLNFDGYYNWGHLVMFAYSQDNNTFEESNPIFSSSFVDLTHSAVDSFVYLNDDKKYKDDSSLIFM